VLLERERAHLAVAGSRAAFFELAFGLADEGRDAASLTDGLTIELPEGMALRASTLRGSIDRVDVVERDGKLYGVAIDYKFGKGESYGKELTEMADFQLPIYCEVLPLFGIEPVGAFYLGIASGERYGVVRSDFASQFAPEDSKGVRALEPEAFRTFMGDRQAALRLEIARLARGELATRPRRDDCGYCDLRPVCRIGTFGVGGKSAEE
jgi:RecB family exonuclease